MRVALTFGPGNRQALDAKVGAEPVNDKQGPLGIGDGNKDKVGNQIVVLGVSAEDGLRAKDNRDVDNEGAHDQGNQLDSEVREGHLCDMCKNDLGGHASKDNADGDRKEDKVLSLKDVRGRGGEPSVGADKEQGHGQQLRVSSDHRLVLLLARLVNGDQAWGNMAKDKQQGHPADHEVQEDPVLGEDAKVGAKDLDDLAAPEHRALESRDQHDNAGNDQTLGGSVDISKVEDASVVLLPGGQEEGQGGQEQEEGRVPGVAHGHAGSLVDGSNAAVQGVASVVKELTQGRGRSSAAGLLSIHVVKGRVQPQSNRAAVCYVRRNKKYAVSFPRGKSRL